MSLEPHPVSVSDYIRLLAQRDAKIERLVANRLDLICWMADESQIVSGCRDDYERGRYEAFRQVLDREEPHNATERP